MSSYVNFCLERSVKSSVENYFLLQNDEENYFFVDENSFIFPIVEDLFSDKREKKKVHAIFSTNSECEATLRSRFNRTLIAKISTNSLSFYPYFNSLRRKSFKKKKQLNEKLEKKNRKKLIL